MLSVIGNQLYYRIFPAIRRGFRPSRMTSNNLISPMKFCYNTNSNLPKQCQSSRSILQDGSRTFGLFWKEKTLSYNRRNTVSSVLPLFLFRFFMRKFFPLTLLHSERPKLYGVLAILNAIGLREDCFLYGGC